MILGYRPTLCAWHVHGMCMMCACLACAWCQWCVPGVCLVCAWCVPGVCLVSASASPPHAHTTMHTPPPHAGAAGAVTAGRCAQAPNAACGGSRRRWCRHTHRCRRRCLTPHVPLPAPPLQSPLFPHEPPATSARCCRYCLCCSLPPLLHAAAA